MCADDDVVEIEQYKTICALSYASQEFPLGHVTPVKLDVAGQVLDQDLSSEYFLYCFDATRNVSDDTLVVWARPGGFGDKRRETLPLDSWRGQGGAGCTTDPHEPENPDDPEDLHVQISVDSPDELDEAMDEQFAKLFGPAVTKPQFIDADMDIAGADGPETREYGTMAVHLYVRSR